MWLFALVGRTFQMMQSWHHQRLTSMGQPAYNRMHHIWIHEQHLATMQWFRRQKLQEQFDKAAEQAKTVENPGSSFHDR